MRRIACCYVFLLTSAIWAADQVRVNPKDGLPYVLLKAGTFDMGCSVGDKACPDYEKPARAVRLTKAFWIGRTEVTVGAYKRFAKATDQPMPPEPVLRGRHVNPGWSNDSMPVVAVTWGEAKHFCEWGGGRLPTAAE